MRPRTDSSWPRKSIRAPRGGCFDPWNSKASSPTSLLEGASWPSWSWRKLDADELPSECLYGNSHTWEPLHERPLLFPASLQLWTHGCCSRSASKWWGLCWLIQGYTTPKGSRVFQMWYLTAAFCHGRCRWTQKMLFMQSPHACQNFLLGCVDREQHAIKKCILQTQTIKVHLWV